MGECSPDAQVNGASGDSDTASMASRRSANSRAISLLVTVIANSVISGYRVVSFGNGPPDHDRRRPHRGGVARSGDPGLIPYCGPCRTNSRRDAQEVWTGYRGDIGGLVSRTDDSGQSSSLGELGVVAHRLDKRHIH